MKDLKKCPRVTHWTVSETNYGKLIKYMKMHEGFKQISGIDTRIPLSEEQCKITNKVRQMQE